MRIYNPFNKIKDLNYQLEQLRKENRDIQIKLDRANGNNHKVGIWCQGCKNLMVKERSYPYCDEKFCKLDIKCPDRTETCNGQ